MAYTMRDDRGFVELLMQKVRDLESLDDVGNIAGAAEQIGRKIDQSVCRLTGGVGHLGGIGKSLMQRIPLRNITSCTLCVITLVWCMILSRRSAQQ